MISKSKTTVKTKNKESNIFNTKDALSRSSEDEIGFQYFFQDQIEKDYVEDSTEAEAKARISWNNLNSADKKSFSQLGKVEGNNIYKHKSNRSPSPNGKKLKRDIQNVENSITKHENESEPLFQMEIQRLIASPAQYCFQPVCSACETYTESKDVLQCNGICKRYFHLHCLESLKENHPTQISDFQCVDCFSNVYKCILCKKVDKLESLLSCENSDCGRLYHRSCLETANFIGMEIDNNNRISSCPAHYCISCVQEDSSFAQNPCKKLIECLKCPLSFHCNDICMAAGSYELSLSHVICPRHFQQEIVKLSPYKPFHPVWCFKCFKTGIKLQCEYCPASFHVECVDNSTNIGDIFICYNCRNYRQPRYGEVLFVKVSQYRWWPCEIIHPRNAPMNILKLNRPDGTYPVLFLGSNEYQWVAKTRSINFNTAQQSSIFKDTCGTSRMDRDFSSGLKTAIKIHQIYVNILLQYVPIKSMTAPPMTEEELYPFINVKEMNQKTIKFKVIKDNILISPAKLPSKIPPSKCDCIESCQLFQCKNYLNKIECQLLTCPTKSKCKNQQFTNHVNKNIAVFKFPNRGYGLKTMVAINKNDFIIEYLGELITKTESNIRIQNAKKLNTKDVYMVKLTSDLIIDAGPKGNLSRYLNHSCDPNCYLENWIVNGYPRKGVFALKDIEPDQELTFDYRISGVIMKEDTFCLCLSNNCTGFLGPIKSLPNSPFKSPLSSRNSGNLKEFTNLEEKISELPDIPIDIKFDDSIESFKDIPLNLSDENILIEKSESVESKITEHENFCYRCFDGGNLVLCDKTSCPKTYHLSCLGLEEAPPGTWYCPWHFCDICGKPSKLFCVRCPASFCDTHAEETNIVVPTHETRKSICQLHKNTKDSMTKDNQRKKSENIFLGDYCR